MCYFKDTQAYVSLNIFPDTFFSLIIYDTH